MSCACALVGVGTFILKVHIEHGATGFLGVSSGGFAHDFGGLHGGEQTLTSFSSHARLASRPSHRVHHWLGTAPTAGKPRVSWTRALKLVIACLFLRSSSGSSASVAFFFFLCGFSEGTPEHAGPVRRGRLLLTVFFAPLHRAQPREL